MKIEKIECIKDIYMDSDNSRIFTKGCIYSLIDREESVDDNFETQFIYADEYNSFFKEHFKFLDMRSTQTHYETGKNYDIIDVCKDYSLNFNRGNVMKYIARAGKKQDELGDLIKAKDYLEREIDYLRRNKPTIDR